MSNKIEYSRLVLKRSTQTGIEPSATSSTVIDETWPTTTLLTGEAFVNVEDDRAWIATNNGVMELQTSSTFSSSALWIDNITNISLGSTHSGKPVIPGASQSVLGTTSSRWGGLYVGDNQNIDTESTLRFTQTSGVERTIFYYDVNGISLWDTLALKSNNGNGQLELDYLGLADNVLLSTGNTTTNSSLYLSPDQMYLSSPDITNGIITVDGRRTVNIGGIGNTSSNVVIYAPQDLTIEGDTIIATTKVIKSGNGGGQIDLDYSGGADNILITTDNGNYSEAGIDLGSGPDYVSIFAGNGGDYEANIGGGIHLYDNTNNIGIAIGKSVIQAKDTLIIRDSGSTTTTPNSPSGANVLINARNSTMNAGSEQSLILGGDLNTLTATASIIVGGNINTVTSDISAIVAGGSNLIDSTGLANVIIGGGNNEITGTASFGGIIGGQFGDVLHDRSVILGGTGVVTTREDTAFTYHLENTGARYKKLMVVNDADYVVSGDDHIISFRISAITTVKTITLPTNPDVGREIVIKKILVNLGSTLQDLVVDAGTNSFDFGGGKVDTIGPIYPTTHSLEGLENLLTIVWDGTNWIKI